MEFKRTILKYLEEWKISKYRKPLILRGARQVGKTRVVKNFGESFDTFVHLDLETVRDRKLFENDLSLKDILQRIHPVRWG